MAGICLHRMPSWHYVIATASLLWLFTTSYFNPFKLLITARVRIRRKVMFWHASVLPSIHQSVCPLNGGGEPISHNALQHFPECHGADTGGGWYPARSSWAGGGYPAKFSQGGTQVWYPPWPGQDGGGGYPVRTTEGVVTTRRAVCLLHSHRRTFLLKICITDCVHSTTGRLCFDSCQAGAGGYPSQVQAGGGGPLEPGPGRGVPQPGPGRGVPHLGYPLPHQTWPGVPQLGGYPTSGTPQSDLASEGGYPSAGGGTPPSSTWYAAVSMPLAFTQEDFLVLFNRTFLTQMLAIYDRFGRLQYGNENVIRDILEYVVFEKHIVEEHTNWRIHGKVTLS